MAGSRKLIIAAGSESLFIYGRKIGLPPLGLANTVINQGRVGETEGALKKWNEVEDVLKKWQNDFLKEKSIPTKAYTAQGFLPLLWAEIRYFAENDIFARPCRVCGRWFPVKNQRGTKHCFPECRSEAKRVESRQRHEGRKNQMRGD